MTAPAPSSTDVFSSLPVRYLRPQAFDRRVSGPLMTALTRLGISVRGSRVLRVRGRRSGLVRSVPVNLLDFEGQRYLVAPRGNTEWVRNVRVAGSAELVVGRRVETVRLVELEAAVKVPVLRAYLRRWKFEVGRFFAGLGVDATDEQFLAAADGYPVFQVCPSEQ